MVARPGSLDPRSGLCYGFPPVTHHLFGLAQAAAPGGPGGLVGSVLPFVLIFGVFYFLVIMPQQKKAKQHQRMLAELKKGDDVVTQGGIIGQITGIKEDELTIQVQEGVRLRVRRSHVTEKVLPFAEKKA